MVLLLQVPITPAWAEGWTPTFKSDEPVAVIEPLRKPRAPKRRTVYAKKRELAQVPARVSTNLHRLAIQVAENNPQVMNLALNNARNVVEYYKAKGEKVAIEVVTFGPGLHMLRNDTSPVK